MEKLTSRNNERIKQAVKLCRSASERKKTGLFFLEGLRLCTDAAKTGITPVSVFLTEDAYNKNKERLAGLLSVSERNFLITDEISDKLSDTKTSQGVFCVCKVLDKNHNIDKINYNGIYIAVENIATPDNLGAVARTAEALGLDGLIVSGGCDVYNPKSQRAAMGSLLRLPVFETDDLPSLLSECNANGMKTYAAVPDSDALPVTEIDRSSGVISVIGNEGNGLTEEAIRACSERMTIPMKGRAESLNAAAAASVIMWEMIR